MTEKTAPAGELTDGRISEIYGEPCDWALPHILAFARRVIAADRELRASHAAGDVAMPVVARITNDYQLLMNTPAANGTPLVKQSDAQAALAAKDAVQPAPIAQPVHPAAEGGRAEFQIAILKELADVKQTLLATEGRLATNQRMLANCERQLLEDVEKSSAQPEQPADAERDALRIKADRYDWLRASGLYASGINSSDVDIAIDAAMTKAVQS